MSINPMKRMIIDFATRARFTAVYTDGTQPTRAELALGRETALWWLDKKALNCQGMRVVVEVGSVFKGAGSIKDVDILPIVKNGKIEGFEIDWLSD